MFMIMNFILIMITSLMFFLTHPLSMGLMILIQTFFICLISGMLINTYWFSYILFLTFLGGLLVLFIYVSSIASNELFKFSFKLMIFLLFMIMSLTMIMFLYNIKINILLNSEINMMNENFIFFNNENKLSLIKLYNPQTYLLMFMLIIYLLITLIAIVKITNNIFGPLRLMI